MKSIGFYYVAVLTLICTLFLYIAALTLQGASLSLVFTCYFYLLLGISVITKQQIGHLTQVLEQINVKDFDHRDVHFNSIFNTKLLEQLLRTYRELGRINTYHTERNKEVEFSASQVIETSSQVKENVQKQSDATNSTAAAVEELSQSLKEVNTEISNTYQSSRLAAELSEQGQKSLQLLNVAVSDVNTQAQNTQQSIVLLDELVKSVREITESIHQISQQTNLLALNASIEAARAGDMGRGFAVVASEVRDLAIKTTTATDSIDEKINLVLDETTKIVETMSTVVQKTEHSLEKTQLVDEAFNDIYTATDEVKLRMDSVNSVSLQQTATTQEIAKHISLVVIGAEENAKVAVQSEQVANHLRKLTKTVA